MKLDHDLETLLGYQLNRALQIMEGDARRVLEPEALTPAKLAALLIIRANPGCDQTALARALSINRSSAMKLINTLAAFGFIERRPGRNLRTNALHLLADAAGRLEAMVVAVRESDKAMSARLSPAERASIASLVRRVGPARSRRTAVGS